MLQLIPFFRIPLSLTRLSWSMSILSSLDSLAQISVITVIFLTFEIQV